MRAYNLIAVTLSFDSLMSHPSVIYEHVDIKKKPTRPFFKEFPEMTEMLFFLGGGGVVGVLFNIVRRFYDSSSYTFRTKFELTCCRNEGNTC